jgi:hypothetical protein
MIIRDPRTGGMGGMNLLAQTATATMSAIVLDRHSPNQVHLRDQRHRAIGIVNPLDVTPLKIAVNAAHSRTLTEIRSHHHHHHVVAVAGAEAGVGL